MNMELVIGRAKEAEHRNEFRVHAKGYFGDGDSSFSFNQYFPQNKEYDALAYAYMFWILEDQRRHDDVFIETKKEMEIFLFRAGLNLKSIGPWGMYIPVDPDAHEYLPDIENWGVEWYDEEGRPFHVDLLER